MACKVERCEENFTEGLWMDITINGVTIERVWTQLCKEHKRAVSDTDPKGLSIGARN